MEQTEIKEQPVTRPGDVKNLSAITPSPLSRIGTALIPQAGGGTCATCRSASGPDSDDTGMATLSFLYSPGIVDPRFPNRSVEKEVAQAIGRAAPAGLTDRQTLYEVLKNNRYLARRMCWVLSHRDIDKYILQPRDPADFALLVEALSPNLDPMNHFDVVIGVRGPIAPPEMCNGLMVPVVLFDQMYTFNRDDFINAVPRPDNIPEEQFRPAVRELFDRIMQIADNDGATDEHRALNYLALRYPDIYAKAAEKHIGNFSLTAVDASPSLLSGVQKIIRVTFSYTHRNTPVTERFCVDVDVTGEFPFLVTRMSPCFDR